MGFGSLVLAFPGFFLLMFPADLSGYLFAESPEIVMIAASGGQARRTGVNLEVPKPRAICTVVCLAAVGFEIPA